MESKLSGQLSNYCKKTPQPGKGKNLHKMWVNSVPCQEVKRKC